MGDYDVIDAALDGVKNYMRAIDTDANAVNVYLSPRFNEDGETTDMGYSAEIYADNPSRRITLEQEFATEQNFTGISSFEDLNYLEWIKRFHDELPGINLHYISAPAEDEVIKDSVEKIEGFLEIFREDQKNLSVLMDPRLSDKLGNWIVDYSIRANIGKESTVSSMEISVPFDNGGEDFMTIYPLLIDRIKRDYPEAKLFYPRPDEI